jgi:hypothetical protein
MKQLFKKVYAQLPVHHSVADKDLHLLSAAEKRHLRVLERWALLASGVVGVLGVLLLYLPQYQWPALFWTNTLELPWLGAVSFSWTAIVYGVVLVFVEVWALTFIHLYCVHQMSVVTGFIQAETKAQTEKYEKLWAISAEKKDKSIQRYGLDPYQGMPAAQVWLFNVLFSLKATLSNVFVKWLVQRLLGRYAVREVLDLLGIPVFAFWNMMATQWVLREARVTIMGQNLLLFLRPRFQLIFEKTKHLPNKNDLIYDTLQLIAISKRDYHANHAFLAALVLETFEVPTRSKHLFSKNYVQQLTDTSAEMRRFCQLLMLLGLILDGELSWREKNRLKALQSSQLIDLSVADMRIINVNFLQGQGIDLLLKKYLL